MFAQPGSVVFGKVMKCDCKPVQVKAEVPRGLVCFTAHVITLFNTIWTPAVQLDHQSPRQFGILVYWLLQESTVPFDCETISREQIS